MRHTFKTLKLGTECLDKATELPVTVTHAVVGMSRMVTYIVQPRGLNENGQPLKGLYVPLERLQVNENSFEDIDVPFEILGSIVTDRASSFTGMAVHFVRHLNGCFHVVIQPKGKVKKTGQPIQDCEFDLRGCIGKMIPALSEAELKKSKEEKPSPADGSFTTGLC